MKKIIALVLALLMVTVVWIGSGIGTEAKCSGWTEVTSSTSCDHTDSCGFLWLNDGTQYITGTKERFCDKDGSQKHETTYYSKKDGCCD